jgi:hypothetical protein
MKKNFLIAMLAVTVGTPAQAQGFLSGEITSPATSSIKDVILAPALYVTTVGDTIPHTKITLTSDMEGDVVVSNDDIVSIIASAPNSPVNFDSKEWKKAAAKTRGAWDGAQFPELSGATNLFRYEGRPKNGSTLELRFDGISGRVISAVAYGIGASSKKPYTNDGLRLTFRVGRCSFGDRDDRRDWVLTESFRLNGTWFDNAPAALRQMVEAKMAKRYALPEEPKPVAPPVITTNTPEIPVTEEVDEDEGVEEVELNAQDAPEVMMSDPRSPKRYFMITPKAPYVVDVIVKTPGMPDGFMKNVSDKNTVNGVIWVPWKVGRSVEVFYVDGRKGHAVISDNGNGKFLAQ